MPGLRTYLDSRLTISSLRWICKSENFLRKIKMTMAAYRDHDCVEILLKEISLK